MSTTGKNMDITRNIRLIEWLKCELLSGMASLSQALYKGKQSSQDALADIIASMVLACYLLARRLGITFAAVDMKIQNKIKLGIAEEHEIEKWFQDLSELAGYINRNRDEHN